MAVKNSETCGKGPNENINEAVCIDTCRVYDSCADKDCLADLRVYFTDCAQEIIDSATGIRHKGCEILNVFTNVEPVPFNSGYYSVDITFFFEVKLDVFTTGCQQPICVSGLSVFSKKCILYGSEGNVKVFTSEYDTDGSAQTSPVSTNPRAKIQVAAPICLEAKLCCPCECCNNIQDPENGIPRAIRCCFEGCFCVQSDEKAVKVTIGLFSIIRLERDVQMLIPAYDFCMPDKECCCNTENPCDSFKKIRFPVSEFFPPNEPESADDGCAAFNPQCDCGK